MGLSGIEPSSFRTFFQRVIIQPSPTAITIQYNSTQSTIECHTSKAPFALSLAITTPEQQQLRHWPWNEPSAGFLERLLIDTSSIGLSLARDPSDGNRA